MIQKKIINSVSSQILFILVSSVVSLALVPITITMLGKIEYGAFELILSLILIDVFLEFGIGSTLVKYIPEIKHDIDSLRTFVWSYYYIKLLLTMLGFIGIVVVGYNFDALFDLEGVKDIESIKIAVYIFGLGLIINSAATFLDNYLKGFVYFGMSNGARIVSTLLFFMVYYLYYIENESNNYSIIHIAIIWFVLRPLFLMLSIIAVLKYLKLSYILKPVKYDLLSIKSTLRYVFGMTYIVMMAQLYNRMPKIILGVFSGPIYVAYWGIMEKVKEPLIQLQSSMLRPLIPIMSDKNNMANISSKNILQAVRLQYFFMSFLGIMVIMHIDLLVKLWIGSQFDSVAEIVKIIMVVFLFPNAGVFLMIYYAQGKTKINSIFVTINAVISLVVATSMLLLTNDIMLFAWVFSIVLIIMSLFNIVTYIVYFKLSKMKFIKDSVFSTLLTVVTYYLVIKNIGQFLSHDLNGLILSIFASIFLFICLFFIFMKCEDKELIYKLFKRGGEIGR